MKFNEKLQQLRKSKNLSQEQLAELLSVSRQAISKWELGTTTPELEKVIKISQIFSVSTDYLLGIVENEQDEAQQAQNTQTQEDETIPLINKKNSIENERLIHKYKFMSGLIKKHSHVAGYIVSAYGFAFLLVSRFLAFSISMMSNFSDSSLNSDAFYNYNSSMISDYEAQTSSILTGFNALANGISIIAIIVIIAGFILAFRLKKKFKNSK